MNSINYSKIRIRNKNYLQELTKISKNSKLRAESKNNKVYKFSLSKDSVREPYDLLSSIILEIQLPDLETGYKWKENFIYKLINKIELVMNNDVIIEEFSGEFIYIQNYINNQVKNQYYNQLIGNNDNLINNWNKKEKNTIYLPINFSALKKDNNINILGFQYTNLEILIKINNLINCIETNMELGMKNINLNTNNFDINLILKKNYLDGIASRNLESMHFVTIIERVREYNFILDHKINLNNFNDRMKYILFYLKSNENNNDIIDNVNLIQNVKLTFDNNQNLKLDFNSLSKLNFYQLFNIIPDQNIYLINFISNLEDFNSAECPNGSLDLEIKFNQNTLEKIQKEKIRNFKNVFSKKNLPEEIIDHIKLFLDYSITGIIKNYEIKFYFLNTYILINQNGISGLQM